VAQHATAVFGLHFGTPMKASVVMGAGYVLSRREIRPGASLDTHHADRTVFVAFEPGKGGKRLSAGYGALRVDGSRGGTIINGRASIFWPHGGAPGRVYAGPELSASAMADLGGGVRIGGLRAMRPVTGRRTLIPVDFAIGW
jgi:hypothetical protein